MRTAEEVLQFWFVEHTHEDWFGAKAAFDAELAARFVQTHAAVGRGEAYGWRRTPAGRLAEIVVLDQFSRQLYRNSARAFAWDAMALALAQEAVAGGFDQGFSQTERMFLYLPFQHSESLLIHEESLRLHADLDEEILGYAKAHRAVLERFGRYPKRNVALGRVSTPEELSYIVETKGMF